MRNLLVEETRLDKPAIKGLGNNISGFNPKVVDSSTTSIEISTSLSLEARKYQVVERPNKQTRSLFGKRKAINKKSV
jgi:hypothetical protein